LAVDGSVFRGKSSAFLGILRSTESKTTPWKVLHKFIHPRRYIMLNVFKNKNSKLHIALRSNAIFCDVSGFVIVLAAKPLSQFLGLQNPAILVGLGIGLIAWALMLFWGSMQEEIPNWLAWLAINGDLAWVIGSAIILFLPAVSLSTAGKWTVAIVADIVLVFAIWQFFALRGVQKASGQKIIHQDNPQGA
jgi:hypothetical protein